MLKFEVDFLSGRPMFSRAELQQLAFAISLGTNNTASDIARGYKRSEKAKFPRSTRPRRVKVQRGRKKNPVAYVGVVRPKQSRSGRKIPAITRAEAEILKLTKRYYGNRVFEMVGRGNVRGLFVREGRARTPLDLKFRIEEKRARRGGLPSVRLRAMAKKIGGERFQPNFEAAMRFALKTAR